MVLVVSLRIRGRVARPTAPTSKSNQEISESDELVSTPLYIGLVVLGGLIAIGIFVSIGEWMVP